MFQMLGFEFSPLIRLCQHFYMKEPFYPEVTKSQIVTSCDLLALYNTLSDASAYGCTILTNVQSVVLSIILLVCLHKCRNLSLCAILKSKLQA